MSNINTPEYNKAKDVAAILVGIMLTEVGDEGVTITEATDTKSLMTAIRNLHKRNVISEVSYRDTIRALSTMRNIELLNA